MNFWEHGNTGSCSSCVVALILNAQRARASGKEATADMKRSQIGLPCLPDTLTPHDHFGDMFSLSWSTRQLSDGIIFLRETPEWSLNQNRSPEPTRTKW